MDFSCKKRNSKGRDIGHKVWKKIGTVIPKVELPPRKMIWIEKSAQMSLTMRIYLWDIVKTTFSDMERYLNLPLIGIVMDCYL